MSGASSPVRLTGTVTTGRGCAGRYLSTVLPLIEARSGLRPLIPNTLNVRLPGPYFVTAPDFVVAAEEYRISNEDLRFQHCTVQGVPCLIVRPATHDTGAHHGPAHLELMSTAWLRERLELRDGDPLVIEVGRA